MKVDRVEVTYGRTLNTGNYSSVHLEVRLEATLDECESPHEAALTLFAEGTAIVRERAKPFTDAQKALRQKQADNTPLTEDPHAAQPE